MLGSIFIGLSGMRAYSRALDTISNNVANLNTPGFKLAIPTFNDLRSAAGAGRGIGVEAGQDRLSFRQADARDSANSLDAALDGDGFFVLDRDGERLFTRAGQFELDEDGFLIERTTQARVLMRTPEQKETYFSIDDLRALPPEPTTKVSLAGGLARTGNAVYDSPNINVLDASGATNVLRAKITRNNDEPLRWTVEVLAADERIVGSGEIRFNADGTPAEGFNTIAATVRPDDLPEFTVTLAFGEPGSFSGVTSLASATFSQLQVQRQDGFTVGTLTQASFDAKGRLTLTYSNGQTRTPATLLLARFGATDALRASSGGMFIADTGVQPYYDVAQSAGLGSIVGESIEPSNVEITEQFTDLIIIQRGYQASSQMASVANEMLQQLLAMGQQR
jgi:flagellar hook protein FlgE